MKMHTANHDQQTRTQSINLAIIGCFALGLAACGSDRPTSSVDVGSATFAKAPACNGVPTGTSSLQIAPSIAITIGIGATLDYTVANQAGVVVPDCALSWSTSNSKIATVSSTGLATGKALGGPITVQAQTSGKPSLSANVLLSVGPAIATISIAPSISELTIGDTRQLSVSLLDVKGQQLTNRLITWKSSNNTVAQVSSTGLVTSLAAGTATITATSEGKSSTATITVSVPSGLVAWYPFDGTAIDISGNNRNGTILAGTPDVDRFGAAGKALYFDGISGGVATPPAVLNIQQDYSISLWFKIKEYWAWSRIGNGEVDALVITNPHNGIGVGFDYQVQGRFSNAFGNGSNWLQVYGAGGKTDWTTNTWYHLVVRKVGTTYTTFIDGAVDYSVVLSPISTAVPVQLNFGGGWSFPDNPGWGTINGSIDDVKVFSRALTDAELSKLSADRP